MLSNPLSSPFSSSYNQALKIARTEGARVNNATAFEAMKTNCEKFYEKEQPELVTIQGNELRLYRENMRLSVSKPSWSNSEGVHMGKTVDVELPANKRNQDLIDVLLNAVELLKK